MKKLLIMLLAIVMIVTMVSCDTVNQGDVTTDTTAGSDVTTEATSESSNKTDEDTTKADSTETDGDEAATVYPTVFDSIYTANKDKKLSFTEAVALVEDIVTYPELEEGAESFMINLSAELKASAKSGGVSTEISVPAVLEFVAIDGGDFSLSLTLYDKPFYSCIYVDGVIYASLTDADTGEVTKARISPSDEELEALIAQIQAMISDELGGVAPEDSTDLPEDETTSIIDLLPAPGDEDEYVETEPAYIEDEVINREELESILAEVFGDATPEDIAADMLGDAKLSYNDDHSRFYISAVGGFDNINAKLGELAAALDALIPEEALEEYGGMTVTDIISSFTLKTDSTFIDLIFDAKGNFCGFGADVEIAGQDSDYMEMMGLSNVSAGFTMLLDITVDDTLTVTAPKDADEYVVITVEEVMEMLDSYFGPDDEIYFPEIDIEGEDVISLELVPNIDGYIELSSDPYRRAQQLLYIWNSENPAEEFDCVFKAEGVIAYAYSEDGEYYYTVAVSDLGEDADFYYDSTIDITSDKVYEEGDEVEIYFVIEVVDLGDGFMYVNFNEVEYQTSK
ncbi:MAG: hypothetical protein IJX74_00650 [Clostridia bacterium]|nr:hypothetical protein [Clostridia bacterium]